MILVGLGGAVVVGVLKKAELKGADKGWQDPRERFGYVSLRAHE